MSLKRAFLGTLCLVGAAIACIHYNDHGASLVLVVLAARELLDGLLEVRR